MWHEVGDEIDPKSQRKRKTLQTFAQRNFISLAWCASQKFPPLSSSVTKLKTGKGVNCDNKKGEDNIFGMHNWSQTDSLWSTPQKDSSQYGNEKGHILYCHKEEARTSSKRPKSKVQGRKEF